MRDLATQSLSGFRSHTGTVQSLHFLQLWQRQKAFETIVSDPGVTKVKPAQGQTCQPIQAPICHRAALQKQYLQPDRRSDSAQLFQSLVVNAAVTDVQFLQL